MRIELRDKPEDKKEPVAKLWLGYGSGGLITLYYQIEGEVVADSLAYFNEAGKRFHVFNYDVEKLGYKVSSSKNPL